MLFTWGPHLDPVFAEHWSDAQWHRQDRATVCVCGAIYGRKVSFPIGANLTDATEKYYKTIAVMETEGPKWIVSVIY